MVLLFVNLEPMSFWLVGGRFHAVSRVLQKSEKGVSKVFYGYFKCVLRKTARCSKEISPKFQWCCKQGSFKEVSKDLHKVLLGVYLCQCLKVLFKRSIIIWGLRGAFKKKCHKKWKKSKRGRGGSAAGIKKSTIQNVDFLIRGGGHIFIFPQM